MVQKYISTDLSPTPWREKLWHQNFPSSIIHTRINFDYYSIYSFNFSRLYSIQICAVSTLDRNLKSIRKKKKSDLKPTNVIKSTGTLFKNKIHFEHWSSKQYKTLIRYCVLITESNWSIDWKFLQWNFESTCLK